MTTSTETEESLTYEELAYTIAGLPLAREGKVDRRLAFETAEALGVEGVEELRAFADLVAEFSRLEGTPSAPGTRHPGHAVRLEDLVTERTEKLAAMKRNVPLMEQVWAAAHDSTPVESTPGTDDSSSNQRSEQP